MWPINNREATDLTSRFHFSFAFNELILKIWKKIQHYYEYVIVIWNICYWKITICIAVKANWTWLIRQAAVHAIYIQSTNSMIILAFILILILIYSWKFWTRFSPCVFRYGYLNFMLIWWLKWPSSGKRRVIQVASGATRAPLGATHWATRTHTLTHPCV